MKFSMTIRYRWVFAVAFVVAGALIPEVGAADTGSERWERAIQAFESSDQSNPPPAGAVLFIGSSSIRLWKTLAEDFPNHQVINRGFGGSQIADSIAFLDRIVIPYRPKTIVLYAGDNDIAAGKTSERVLNDFKEFVRRVHEQAPKTKIAFIAIKPSIRRWNLSPQMKEANRLIRDYAWGKRRVTYVDIWNPMLGSDGEPSPHLFVEDGLHLSEAGYQLWTKHVKRKL